MFLWIRFKIAKLRYGHYYYFCILRDVALNYHHTRFGDNCKTQCGNISKTVKKLLTRGHKCNTWFSSLRNLISKSNIVWPSWTVKIDSKMWMHCVVVVKSFISVVAICNPVNRYLFCCFTSCLVTICMNCCLLLFYIAFTNHKMSSQLAKSGIIRGTKIGKSGRYCAVIGCRK